MTISKFVMADNNITKFVMVNNKNYPSIKKI